MQVRLLSLFVMLAALACSPKKDEKEKPLVGYELKTFHLESKGGCAVDTIPCASYEVAYPVFTGLPQAVLDSITKGIALTVSSGNPTLDSLSFEADGHAFVGEFESFVEEFEENTLGWSFDAAVDVVITSDSLISLVSTTEYFTGGAHGGYETYFINLHPVTGARVTLADVLKPGYEAALTAAGEEAFRQSIEFSDSTSYSEQGYEFPEDEFTLNSNYGFTPEGIRFVFNIYEVAPYVMGAQDFVIPYEKIKGWLK